MFKFIDGHMRLAERCKKCWSFIAFGYMKEHVCLTEPEVTCP